MFEDLHRTHHARPALDRYLGLKVLMATHANLKIIDEIGLKENHHISPEVKSHILRRLESEQKKRLLPEATYEQWHHGTECENLVADEDHPTPKRNRSADLPNSHLLGFDVHLRSAAIEELSLQLGSSDNFRDESAEELALSESEEDEFSSDFDSDEEADDSDFDLDDQEDTALTKSEDNPIEELRQSIRFGEKLDQWNSPTDVLRSWLKDRFLLKLWGLEKVGDGADVINSSISKQHLRSLTSLLHINILRRRWLVAYKILCLLARFDAVDLRVLWPIATEILLQRIVELLSRGNVSRLDVLKEEQFLEWIILSFPVPIKPFYSTETYQGPVFRMCTRTYAPIYVLTLLWELLVKRKYSKLRDMLSDLILLPPYSTDGVFFYLLILCNVAESIHLVSSFVHFDERSGDINDEDIGDLANDMMLLGSKDTIKSRILSNVQSAYELLQTCEKLRFELPRKTLHIKLESISSILREESDKGLSEAISETPSAGPYARAGFILAEGELRMGIGQNLIRGELLHRLIVEKKNTLPPSWIWNWIEPQDSSGEICTCKVCGKEVLRTMKLNGEAYHHLAKHRLDHKSAPRLRYQPDLKHIELLESLIDAQPSRPGSKRVTAPRYEARDIEFIPPQSSLDHDQIHEPGASMDSVNASDQKTPKHHESGNDSRDEIDRPDVLPMNQENDVGKSGSHNPNNGEGAATTVPNDFPAASSHPASEGDNIDAENSSEIRQQKSGTQFSRPSVEINTLPTTSNVRRHDGFSPDSTFDVKFDCDISRDFQEFSTQTQTKNLQMADAFNFTETNIPPNVMMNDISFSDTSCAETPNEDDRAREQKRRLSPNHLVFSDGHDIRGSFDDIAQEPDPFVVAIKEEYDELNDHKDVHQYSEN